MIWQWIQNNLGIIIIALSFGVSGIGWLLQQLKEAREKKQAEELRKRARMEALRTGRFEGQAPGTAQAPPTTSPAPVQAETPRQRLEELAKRRQQEQAQRTAAQRRELEEQLRRRREAIDAQKRQQQSARRPAPPPQAQQRPAQPQRGQRPQPRPGQPAQQRPSQPARRPGERRPIAPIPAPPTERPVQETVITDMIERQRRAEDRPIEAPIPVGGSRGSAPLLAMGIDLRKAVIMREIFDKPVGMRGPEQQQF